MACPSCNQPKVVRVPSTPPRIPSGNRIMPTKLPPKPISNTPQGITNRDKITGLRHVPK